MTAFLLNAAGVIFAFGLVIFVHEFGHFIVAKKMGVKVERFSFGLGPEMVGFKWGETRYCIAWIPLGGEVRMAGEMEPGADAPAQRDPREFFAKPWYKRIPIVVAGPAMNYVLAFALFSGIFMTWGDPNISEESIVGEVAKGFPAQVAGLEGGDRVTAVNGGAVATWESLAQTIHQNAEKPLAFQVQRLKDGQSMTLNFTVVPRKDPASGKGMVGITPSMVFTKVGPVQAVKLGAHQTVFWSLHTITYLKERIVKREKPELAGPIGIATVIAKTTETGLQDYLFLIAMISLGIGLFNLFPIPMLDGGHLMFYLAEGIMRRPVSRKAVQTANALGLSVLLGILIFATYSDIQRIRSRPDKPAPAQSSGTTGGASGAETPGATVPK